MNFLLQRSYYLLLVPAALFLWYSIDSFYSYSISAEKLSAHTGKIMSIDTMNASGIPTSKGHYFGIELNTQTNRFFELPAGPGSSANYYVKTHLKTGDAVTLFSEPQLLDGSLRRPSNLVVKLGKDGKTVLKYSDLSKKVYFNMMLISIPICAGFFAWFLITKRRRRAQFL